MQKIFITLSLVVLAASCREPKRTNDKADVSKAEKINWTDSLVMKYIDQTNDSIVKLARKDTIPEEWMLDRTETSDSAKYLVFQIGHTFEHKFITDKWLYIDSLTRNIYEYDFGNDSLMKWPR